MLANSYLVLLLSKKEPFGVIALETIFLKKNFLISRSTGFKDIIGNLKTRNIVKNYQPNKFPVDAEYFFYCKLRQLFEWSILLLLIYHSIQPPP